MKRILIITLLILSFNSLVAMEQDSLESRITITQKSPIAAMTYSVVFPAGGQFYNDKWLKGSIFMGTELAFGGIAAYNYYLNSRGVTEPFLAISQTSLSNAKAYTWIFAAAYVYSIMDAYVDAHFSYFPSEKLILEPDSDINGFQLSMPVDKLLDEEKLARLTSSYFLTLHSSFTLNNVVGLDKQDSKYASLGIGVSISLGRNIFDIISKKKKFKFENLLYDALGIGLGYLTVEAIQK